MRSPGASLDDRIRALRAELEACEVPAPDVLYLLATGLGELPDRLRAAVELPLAELAGVPAPWDTRVLHAGELGGAGAWLLEDAAGDPLEHEPREAWVRGLPAWLAAASGAALCVHASAGSALPGEVAARAPIGGFGLVRDHLNLSGRTPLLGLGASALGPLFPDQTRLHHLGLRRAALGRAAARGHAAAEVVAACTAGPALETPAERRMLAILGADVAVQALGWPLLAAAHAGLAVLSIVAITDAGEGEPDIPGLVEAAGRLQPAMEDLLSALEEDVCGAVAARRREAP
ncbi:MAG: hypothetical protein AB1726_07165 [Planctomycetota bacterium]